MFNPCTTLFYLFSDAISENKFKKNLNYVLLSDIKQFTVEKILEEQNLTTCHGNCLKSKVLSLEALEPYTRNAKAHLVKVPL